MKDFEWSVPTRIVFGNGAVDRLGDEAKPYGKKAMLVYGQSSIKNTGLYDRVRSSLQNAGIAVVDFGGAKSNPILGHVNKGIELAKGERVDFLVAVGGGSVIDTAKAIAIGALTDRDIWDFFTFKALVEKALPIVTVVTIPASGSEMNENVVVTNEQTCEKFGLPAAAVYPRVSIMDPSLTFTVSKPYTAYSAADIFSHVLDAYFTSTADWSPLQDGLAEAVLKAVIRSVDRIMVNPEDYNARSTMMWCATWALNRSIHSGLGYTDTPLHNLEHPVSAACDLPHGAGMSIIIPAWLDSISRQQLSRCAGLAHNVFGIICDDDAEAASRGIAALKDWFDSIGAPTSFSAVGISAVAVENLIETACETNQLRAMGMPLPREYFAGVYNLAR
ncbi:MAG: iron-containing alcohol dehydrogenase [Dehalococcoidia bacterium]|nr:iron-containing alcohol dehydrogenase [Dehalococcoidia bacterium]